MGEKKCVNCGDPDCKRALTEEQIAEMGKEVEQLSDAIGVLAREASCDDVRASGTMRAFIVEMAAQGFNDTEVAVFAMVAIAKSSKCDNLLHLVARVAKRALEMES